MPALFSERPDGVRDLLYLAREPRTWLTDALRGLGWSPVPARDLEAARTLCAERRIRIGLIEIEEGTASPEGSPAQRAEHLDPAGADLPVRLAAACGPAILWIALGSRDQLARPEIRTAISRFCYDFATTPVPVERLAVTLGRAWGMVELRRTVATAPGVGEGPRAIVGTSRAIESVRRSVATFATSDAPVLILGETGTGKALAAAAIHGISARRYGPLVPFGGGAHPPLPGAPAGTGGGAADPGAPAGAGAPLAAAPQALPAACAGPSAPPSGPAADLGLLRDAADDGTVYVDEVADLSEREQALLLQLLDGQRDWQRRPVRLGRPLHTHVARGPRVIAASAADLAEAVHAGRFRRDLYYRLNVLQLRMPPLRERVEDIELLALHTFKTFRHECLQPLSGFSQDALAALRLYSWPGNVRELVNRVRRAMLATSGRWIGAEDLGLSPLPGGSESLSSVRWRAEVAAMRRTFLSTRGNVSEAARRLNVTRSTLYRLIRKYGVDPAGGELPEPPAERRVVDEEEEAPALGPASRQLAGTAKPVGAPAAPAHGSAGAAP